MASKQLTQTGGERGDYLVGRDELLRQQMVKVQSMPAFVGMIYGASGVGKSAFARNLIAKLNSDSPDVEPIFFEVEVAHAPEEPFLILHDRIYDAVKPSLSARVRSAVNKSPVANGVKLLKGVLKDFIARLAGEMEHTADALGDIATDTADLVSGVELRNLINGSNFSKLIDHLSAAAARTNRRYVLVLDGFERSSEAAIQLVDSVSRRLPENIRILLVVNSEEPAFHDPEFVKLRSRLQYRCANSISELPRLTAEDIVEWKRLCTGVTIPAELAKRACDESDGRPILLKPWVESEDTRLEKIANNAGRFYGYYDERFASLTNTEKFLVRLLAVVFPHALQLDWLEQLSGADHGAVAAALDSLQRNGFSEGTENGYRAKHVLIAGFLKSAMGEPLIGDYKRRLFDLLGRLGVRPERRDIPSRLDALKADVVTESAGEEGIRFLLAYSQDILKFGAYRQALDKIAEIDQLFAKGVRATDNERAEVELLRAEVFNHVGKYRDALDVLSKANVFHPAQAISAKLLLFTGEMYFRLNEYRNAVKFLKRARKFADDSDDITLLAQTIIRLAGVAMDLGKWGAARHIGDVLLNKVYPEVTDHSLRCHILRTVARIYAPADQEKAIVLANDAMQLALDIKSDRVLGNCFFALGEVQRHTDRLGDARESYEKSLKIGRDTGNKDLSVYSLMGIVVLALLQGNQEQFLQGVEELRDTLDYDAPAEKANGSLFVAIKNLLGGASVSCSEWSAIREDLLRLRRYWQAELVDFIEQNKINSMGAVSEKLRHLNVVF